MYVSLIATGFPSPSKLKGHSSFITATPTTDGDYLSGFVPRGTQTESTGGRYKLITLSVEETTDSSDSVFESDHEIESTEDDENVSEASQKRIPGTRGSRRNLKLTDQRDSFTEKRSSQFRDEPNLRHNVTLTGQKESPNEEKSLNAMGKTRSHHNLRLMSQRESSKHVHSPTAKRQEKTHSSPALFKGKSHTSETTSDHRNKEQGTTKGQQTLSPTETTHETVQNAESVDHGNVISEAVSEDGSDERWKLKATPQGSSTRFSTSVPQETTKFPESRQEVGREEGSGEHRTTKGSYGGRRGGRKKLRVTSPSRYRSTVPPPSLEVTLNPTASSRETEHNSGSYGVGSVEGTADETSSRGRPRMSTKKGTSRKRSTVIPWKDFLKPTDSSMEADKNLETHGEGSNGESETAQKGASENASAVMQQGNQLDIPVSLNKTEPHSNTVAENHNADDGFQAEGSSRERSSTLLSTTIPQEINFHPNISTIKISESMGRSDNDDQGSSQGSSGGGPDERWSYGRLNVTIHKGIFAGHGTSAIPHTNTTVRPEMQNTSAGIRWTVPFEPGRLLEGKRSKQKKKEANEAQDVSPSSAASIVAGLLAAAMVLLVIGTFLW